MIRIDHRTVELTEAEAELSRAFEDFLDQGHSITGAMAIIKFNHPHLDPQFLHYLAGNEEPRYAADPASSGLRFVPASGSLRATEVEIDPRRVDPQVRAEGQAYLARLG